MKTNSVKYYLAAFLSLLFHQAILACPVCFGVADKNSAEANNKAIIFLLSVTGVVLASVAAFFIFLWRRIRRQRKEQLSHAAFVNEHGNLILNNEEGVTEEWKNI